MTYFWISVFLIIEKFFLNKIINQNAKNAPAQHQSIKEITGDDNKITFKTDKFSSFTLAYTDEKVENTTQIENPNTSDKALIYGIVSLIGLSGLVYTAKVLKKRS